MTSEEEIAALKTENARLHEQVEALSALVQELQGRQLRPVSSVL